MEELELEKVRSNLVKEFGPPDAYVPEKGGATILHVGSSTWRGTDMVSRIDIRIEGIYPLSGEPLPACAGKLTAGTHELNLNAVQLNGTYTVHFDAVCIDGSRIPDAVAPQTLDIHSSEAVPSVKWSTARAPGGWTKLKIKTTCRGRVHNALWIDCGTYQKLPDFIGDETVCYVPFDCSNARLIVKGQTDIAVERV